jgi:hypothetical protein
MRTVTLSIILISFVLMGTLAAQCPADRAAEKGFNPFSEFHHVMAPAWHNAWPNKDYDALLEAGPQFAEKFKEIEIMEPVLKSETRKARYEENLEEFGRLVNEYAEAAKAGDKEKVYKLMPDLHEAFENAASSLLPIQYLEIDGLYITNNMILENHLPKNNIEGVTGSTETLLAKSENLNKETIPDELKEKEKEILANFDDMKKVIAEMKKCCDNKDMDSYKKNAEKLNQQLEKFIARYL